MRITALPRLRVRALQTPSSGRSSGPRCLYVKSGESGSLRGAAPPVGNLHDRVAHPTFRVDALQGGVWAGQTTGEGTRAASPAVLTLIQRHTAEGRPRRRPT